MSTQKARHLWINAVRGVVPDADMPQEWKRLVAAVQACNSAKDLRALPDFAEWSALSEWAVCEGLNAFTVALGRGTMGAGDIDGDIRWAQREKLKRYGAKAFRLSERQLDVVCEKSFPWIRSAKEANPG